MGHFELPGVKGWRCKVTNVAASPFYVRSPRACVRLKSEISPLQNQSLMSQKVSGTFPYGVGGESAPGRVGGLAERDPLRPATDGRTPAPAALSGGSPAWTPASSPGSRQRDITTWRPHPGTAAGHWRAAPTLASPD